VPKKINIYHLDKKGVKNFLEKGIDTQYIVAKIAFLYNI